MEERKEYLDNGIHVMAAQNGRGEITIGDSHEYGLYFHPFDKVAVNKLIIDYLKTFLKIDTDIIAETWHGIYPKLTNGDTEIFLSPDPGVYILNGIGGVGMTLSFGLAEEIVEMVTANGNNLFYRNIKRCHNFIKQCRVFIYSRKTCRHWTVSKNGNG